MTTAFEAWFAGDYQRRLDALKGELEHASWDRKAAYLLWLAEDRGQPGAPVFSAIQPRPAPPPSTDDFDGLFG